MPSLAVTLEGYELGPGVIAGKFRVERPLVTTRSSSTHLVRHLLLGYQAVLKVPHGADDAAREARALSLVQSPHVPALLETGIYGDGRRAFPYLIEEYVTGQTLARWMATYRRLDALRLARIALKVASALAAMHRAGLIHGDVKPDNIIVDPMLEAERVCLVDLGAARIAVRDGSGASGARILATPEYMAPELRDGTQPTPASDVYSLALVMFDALSGGCVARTTGAAIPPISSLVPMYERLSLVIERALSSEPSVRFADAAALAHELAALDPAELARFPGSSESLSPVYQDALDTLDVSRPTSVPLEDASTSRPRSFEPPALWSIGRPSIWFLGGDPATDHVSVRSAMIALRSNYEVTVLSEERCDAARVELICGAVPPWVVVFGPNHVARNESLLTALAECGETMNVFVSELGSYNDIMTACRGVSVDGTLSLASGSEHLAAEVSAAANRAARVRRCYDTLRLALGDAREDLDGLQRCLEPLKSTGRSLYSQSFTEESRQ
jgi:serine/threonine protein kinase